MFRSFEDLNIWKRSCRLAVQVYEDLMAELRELSAMLHGLVKALKPKNGN